MQRPKKSSYQSMIQVLLLLLSFLAFTSLNHALEENDPEQTVNPLTIQLLKLQEQFQKASPGQKQQKLAELTATLEARKKALLELMEGHPAKVLEVALPDAVAKSLPKNLQSQLEQSVIKEGRLEVIQEMLAEKGELTGAKLHHALVTDRGERINLHFAGKGPDLLTDSHIRAHGVQLADHLALNSADSGSVETITAAALTPSTTKKVAVILFNFLNNTTQPYTPATAKAVTYTNTNGVNSYYQDTSFDKWVIQGKNFIDGDVYGWYTIPYNSTASSCAYSTWASAARTAAAADGFTTTGYNSVIYTFPGSSGCSWWGLASIGGSPGSAWIQGSYALAVVGHELGHNFGMHHSGSYSCTDANGQRVPISSTCTASEYGDPFDIMGGASHYHMNNYQKGRLGGVLDTVNTQDVLVNGTYTIVPLEWSSTGIQALRIPRDYNSQGGVSMYYYLEFRQPYGTIFDNFSTTAPVVNGVSIRLAPAYTTLAKPLLIDATPGTSGFSDAALPVGQTFEDLSKGITITTKSISSSGAVVDVKFGPVPCVENNPGISLSPSSQWGYPGQSLVYNVTVTNQNSSTCPTATFNVVPTLPSGWAQSPISLSEVLNSGASVTRTFSATSTFDAVPNFYTITEKIVNTVKTQFQASASATYSVRLPDTTPPAVEITTPVDGDLLSGRVTVEASASDDVGVSQVEFYIDNSLKSTDTQTPYSLTLDAKKLTAGSHTIRAAAYDAANNSAGDQITVTVSSTGPGKPKPR